MLPINQYLMTTNERKIYEKLKKRLYPKYEVFPQIPLRAILKRNFNPYKYTKTEKMMYKIVDFLICEKPYYKPVLIVEVNDETHEEWERRVRDSNVTIALKEMGLPIWMLLPEQNYKNPEEMNLNKHIELMIKTWLNF